LLNAYQEVVNSEQKISYTYLCTDRQRRLELIHLETLPV